MWIACGGPSGEPPRGLPGDAAAARQNAAAVREEEQNGLQSGAGLRPQTMGKPRWMGLLRRSSNACAAAHPDVLLHAIKQLLAQVFAVTGGRGPTGRLHLYFVGGYDDGGRS